MLLILNNIDIYSWGIKGFNKMPLYDVQLYIKDLRKNVSFFQEGGFSPAPPALPVIRVVLLHKEGDRAIIYFLKCTYVHK